MQRTQPDLKEDTAIYPVIVYIHSGDFSSGTSQIQPGHVLTLQNVVVVTFNYRLGALGRLNVAHQQYNFTGAGRILLFCERPAMSISATLYVTVVTCHHHF